MTPTTKRYSPLTGHGSLTTTVPVPTAAPVVAPRTFSRARMPTQSPAGAVARAQARLRTRTAPATVRPVDTNTTVVRPQPEAPTRPALRTEQIHNEIVALRNDFDARFAVLIDELQQIRSALGMDAPVEMQAPETVADAAPSSAAIVEKLSVADASPVEGVAATVPPNESA